MIIDVKHYTKKEMELLLDKWGEEQPEKELGFDDFIFDFAQWFHKHEIKRMNE